MIKKVIFLITTIFIIASTARADELWLRNIPVAKLLELYQTIGYTGIENKSWLMLKSLHYPAVLLKNFPPDFNSIEDKDQRNALFIKILAPLALKLNQNLQKERQQILDIQKSYRKTQAFTPEQTKLLEEKAAKYDIFTHLKNDSRLKFLLKELLNRIDIVPPSIMITLSAIETDFGSSRVVKEGNSLYKMLVWHTTKGLKPIGETEDDSYRIKIYDDIYRSMEDFALRINSHPNFGFLRIARANIRQTSPSSTIIGANFAAYSFSNSELHNYAGIIDYTLSYYELSIIDRSTLDNSILTPSIFKKYSKFLVKK